MLAGFIVRYIQNSQVGETLNIPSESYADFTTLFGLLQRVRRLAHAYMRLRNDGFGSEGEVLIRAALEHAVTAQWAYLTPGGVKRLDVTLTAKQKEFAEVMASTSENPDMRAWAEQRPAPDGKQLPKFTGDGIMADLDDIQFLKATYKVLSQVGHVSHEAWLDAFVNIDGQLHIRDQPVPSMEHEMLYSLAGFCLLSAWIMARIQGDEQEIRRLQERGVQLHLPWRLDTHMPPERRRFPDEEN